MRSIVAVCFSLAIATAVHAQDYAKILESLDPHVYPAGSEQSKNAPLLFEKMLKAERDRVNRDDVASWQKLAAKKSTKEWELFVRGRIAMLQSSLGRLPALDAKEIPVHVSKTLPGDGFAIDNLVYESRPGLWVTANLYRPVPLPKSAPVIAIVHSHHHPKTEGELQDMGMIWARAGCYVLVPDQLGHGERRQHPFATEASYAKPFKVTRQDYYFRYNLGMQLHLVGESLMGWMANDMSAGLTMALAKPNADPKRTILLGAVAGGGDIAAVTAALDPRFKCLVPYNFGRASGSSKTADGEELFNFMGSGSWESTRNLAKSASYQGDDLQGFLPWLIVSSVAPRPMIHAHEFAWDKERDPVWKRYQEIWGWYGAGEKLAFAYGKGSVQGKRPDSTHCNNIGPEHRAMIYPHLKRWFDIPVPEKEFSQRLPASDLACWTPELTAKLKPRMVQELTTDRWDKSRGKGLQEERRLVQQGIPIYFGSKRGDKIYDVSDKTIAGIVVRRVVLKFGPQIPVLLLSPQNIKPNGVVVALSERGKQAFVAQRRTQIAGLLREGMTVCLFDFPGAGEVGNVDSFGRSSRSTANSATRRMLSPNALESELSSLQVVLDFLEKDAEQKGAKLRFALWGESFASTNAPDAIAVPHDAKPIPTIGEPMPWLQMIAPLLFGFDVPGNRCRGILIRGGLLTYRSALAEPFVHLSHHSLDRDRYTPYELDDVLTLVLSDPPKKPNKLIPMRFESFIDAQNRAVSQQAIDRQFERIRPRLNDAGVVLQAERSGAEDVVAFFVKCLK